MSLRREVLGMYARILRVARNWKATNPTESLVERDYIQTETKDLFRRNAGLTNEVEIRERLREAEARLTMAEHYRNPYPRPVNLPKRSYSKQEGKKVGKAIKKMNEQSRPVYIRSTDDTVSKSS